MLNAKNWCYFFSQRLVLKNIISNNRDIPEVSTLQEQLIRLAAQHVEQAVLEIDRKKKTVTLEDGRRIKYSKLVVADAWPGPDMEVS